LGEERRGGSTVHTQSPQSIRVRVNHLKVSHLGLAVRVAWEAVCGFSKVVVQKVLESPRLLSRILTGAAQNFSVLPVHEALYQYGSPSTGGMYDTCNLHTGKLRYLKPDKDFIYFYFFPHFFFLPLSFGWLSGCVTCNNGRTCIGTDTH